MSEENDSADIVFGDVLSLLSGGRQAELPMKLQTRLIRHEKS